MPAKTIRKHVLDAIAQLLFALTGLEAPPGTVSLGGHDDDWEVAVTVTPRDRGTGARLAGRPPEPPEPFGPPSPYPGDDSTPMPSASCVSGIGSRSLPPSSAAKVPKLTPLELLILERATAEPHSLTWLANRCDHEADSYYYSRVRRLVGLGLLLHDFHGYWLPPDEKTAKN